MEETLTYVFQKIKAAVNSFGGVAQPLSRKIFPLETGTGRVNDWHLALRNFGTAGLARIDEICPPETRNRWMLAAKTSGGEAVAWFHEIFTPGRVETIVHWIHVAKPYLIAAVVLAVVIRLFGGGGGKGKMMKAPGRNYMMPRKVFQGNPKGYFSDLRARR